MKERQRVGMLWGGAGKQNYYYYYPNYYSTADGSIRIDPMYRIGDPKSGTNTIRTGSIRADLNPRINNPIYIFFTSFWVKAYCMRTNCSLENNSSALAARYYN